MKKGEYPLLDDISQLLASSPISSSHPTNISDASKELVCPHCHKSFCSRGNLNRHLRQVHDANAKKFKCMYPGCNRSFARNTDLRVHERIHSGEKPYKCEIDGCNKRFTRLSDLKVHERTHGESRKIACHWAGCGRKFHRMYDLKLHYMKVHLPHHHRHHHHHHHHHHHPNDCQNLAFTIAPPPDSTHRKRKVHHPECVYHDQITVLEKRQKTEIPDHNRISHNLNSETNMREKSYTNHGIEVLGDKSWNLSSSNKDDKAIAEQYLSNLALQSGLSYPNFPSSFSLNDSTTSSRQNMPPAQINNLVARKESPRCQNGHDALSSIEFINASTFLQEHNNDDNISDNNGNGSQSDLTSTKILEIIRKMQQSQGNNQAINIPHLKQDDQVKEDIEKMKASNVCAEEDCFKVFHNGHIDHLINGRLYHYEDMNIPQNSNNQSGENNELERLVDCGPLKFIQSEVTPLNFNINGDNELGLAIDVMEKLSGYASGTESVPVPIPVPVPAPAPAPTLPLNQNNEQMPTTGKEKIEKEHQPNKQQSSEKDQNFARNSFPQLLTMPCNTCLEDTSSRSSHKSRSQPKGKKDKDLKAAPTALPSRKSRTRTLSSIHKESQSVYCDPGNCIMCTDEFNRDLDLDVVDNERVYEDKLCDLCLQFCDHEEEEHSEEKNLGICNDTRNDHVHHHYVLHGNHVDTLDSLGFLHCNRPGAGG